MARPDFLLIGAPKAGTTTLWAWFRRHPQICMSSLKEPLFFSHADRWAKGWPWYESLFEPTDATRAIGDAAPHYSMVNIFPEAVERIAEHLPDVRILYCVRDPVRALPSFCVMLFEDVVNDTEGTLNACCRFLGVDAFEAEASVEAKNRSAGKKARPRWGGPLRGTPIWEYGKRCLPFAVRDWVMRIAARKVPEVTWDQATLRFVDDQVGEDARRILSYIGRPADVWRFTSEAPAEIAGR